ncbi:MAG: hypothetical protein IAE87_18825 [Rhodobacteraceae bacterium]|nr:hypothetical protein [Paracoccaceae bacterium]
MDLDRRLTMTTGALSMSIAIFAICVLTVFSVRAIIELERREALKEMATIGSLIAEEAQHIEALTRSFADVFIRRGDAETWRSPAALVDRMAEDMRTMQFVFPGLRNARLISLNPDTGTKIGGEIAFMSPDGSSIWRLSPSLLDTSYNMAFVLATARAEKGAVIFDILRVLDDQDDQDDQDGKAIVVSSVATIITSPTGENLGLLMLDIDVTDPLARIANKLSDQEQYAIWPVDTTLEVPGIVSMRGQPPRSASWSEYSAAIAANDNLDWFESVVGRSDAPGDELLRLTYVRQRSNLGFHAAALLSLTVVIILLSMGLSLVLARFVSRPITELIGVARDVASGNKSIEDLEVLAKSSEENILVDAMEEMRRTLDDRGAVIIRIAKRLDMATSAARIGIWERVTDRQKPEFWNEALVKSLLGNASPGDSAPQTDSHLRNHVHPDDLAAFDLILTWEDGQDPAFSIMLRLCMADGKYRSHQMIGHQYQRDTGPVSIIAALIDIEEFKRLDRMKNELLSTVGHEMKTPLTSIIGAIGILSAVSGTKFNDQERQLIEMATKNGAALRRIIDDILDLSRVDAGKFRLNSVAMDLGVCVRQTLQECGSYLPEKRVRLVCDSAARDWPICADAARLAQVLRNLLSNAIKFSPDGAEVRVTIEERGSEIRVSVRDFGPGVPPEEERRLFKRFSQIDGSDTRAQGGTGLGLAISMAIVHAHGGTMGYERSDPGATFHFSLPDPARSDGRQAGGVSS